MRLGFFGGSFNPLHLGHLILADSARIAFNLDKVIFVPACISAHKQEANPVDGALRYAMVKSTVEENPFFLADDCEIKRGGISRSIDTLYYLKKKYAHRLKENKISVIIGDDLLEEFYRWKNCEEIAENFDIVVGIREKENFSQDSFFISGGKRFACRFFKNPRVRISSGEVRSAIADGQSWQYFVPPKVRETILENALYGAKEGQNGF